MTSKPNKPMGFDITLSITKSDITHAKLGQKKFDILNNIAHKRSKGFYA